MKYVNADLIFPEALLKEVQKYVHGGMVYIPKPDGVRKKWGEKSGGRQFLDRRNEAIRQEFSTGMKLDQLAEQFCLSRDSIKKIVYTKK
jgi:Mor family transcriptional regulator